jgi:hypothetical protein
MNFQDATVKFAPTRRSSAGTAHWNAGNRDSLLVNSGGVSHEEDENGCVSCMSPPSSITEDSAPALSVNVLKLAQDWKLKKQQEKQHMEDFIRKQSLNPPLQGHGNAKGLKQTTPKIMEPKEIYDKDVLTSDEIQAVFVEMCFYARLGFVQPPCCLLCTYRESMEQKEPNSKCCRWVIWRRDGELLLHPNQLEGNILLTTCHVARSLLSGNTVDGYAWDATNKKLVLSCASNE